MSRNTLRVLRLFVVIIPQLHGSGDSDNQSTDGVCSLNLLAHFQMSKYPNGGVLRAENGSMELSPIQYHF